MPPGYLAMLTPDATSARRRPLLLAYGFRPFFLLAGVWALVPMAVLLWSLTVGTWSSPVLPLFAWHGHEMLFGFTAAAIAGFLLTAVPSWTNTRAVAGTPLALLIALWAFARIAVSPLFELPGIIAGILSVAFFPTLAFLLARPLLRSRNVRNLPFLALLALLFLADLLYLGPRYGWFPAPPFDPLRITVDVVLIMVVVVGGRIIPAFTRNALATLGRPAVIRPTGTLDTAAVITVAAVLAGDLTMANTIPNGVIAAVAALLLGLRMRGWGSCQTLDLPLLWVLHLGYAWLVVGLGLKAAWLLAGFGWAQNWLHALTAGAFGTMILGVTTRAALGHTGRPLEVGTPIVAAYCLVSLSALLRVLGPWLLPRHFLGVLTAAAAAWLLAYSLYLLVYLPILVSPRADGKPG